MTPEEVFALTLTQQHLDDHGLHDWTPTLDNAKRRLGQCRYARREIGLSRDFILHNSDDAVEQVILHEVAHALAGPGTGHGPKWRATARRLGVRRLRANQQNVTLPPPKWQVVCPDHGLLALRHRRTKDLIHAADGCNLPVTFRPNRDQVRTVDL